MTHVEAKQATQLLHDGEVLIAALDDMLALICDARSDEALALLRKLKSRPGTKGFSILMDSDARVNRYVKEVPALAWDIFDTTEHAPVILILPQGQQLSSLALASDGSIAVRMVTNREEQKLVQIANAPIACTALLTADGLPAATLDEADPTVLEEVRYVLSLPTAKKHYPPAAVPVIKLGLGGEVKIIRG